MTDIHTISEDGFNAAVVAASLTNEHTADTVDVLNRLEPEEAAKVLRLLPRETAVEILDKPELDFGAEIIEALPRDLAAMIPLFPTPEPEWHDRTVGVTEWIAPDAPQDYGSPARRLISAGVMPSARNSRRPVDRVDFASLRPASSSNKR